jgi:hypothetical protein
MMKKQKTPSTPTLLNKFIELDLKNDLSKTQVEETIEKDLTLDSGRNLSTIQEDISLFMEEEEATLSPNKETTPPQYPPQTTTTQTAVVQTRTGRILLF